MEQKPPSSFDKAANILTVLAMLLFAGYFLRNTQQEVFGFGVMTSEQVSPASAAAQQKKTLKLLTYNILVHAIQLDKRLPALLKIIRDEDADIVTLQETETWFTQGLAAQGWSSEYIWVDADPGACGGQFILSKFPVVKSRCFLLPGWQGRTVLIATLNVHGRYFDVATSHLEAPLDDGPTRGDQIAAVLAKIRFPADALFMGDFNAGDGVPERKRIDPSYLDIWPTLHPKEPGYTWDNEKSDMDRLSPERFKGEPSRRLDWMLLRSEHWKPKEIHLVGNAPIVAGDKSLFPSDHFGVVATLEMK